MAADGSADSHWQLSDAATGIKIGSLVTVSGWKIIMTRMIGDAQAIS
jgi:hypothetical protein